MNYLTKVVTPGASRDAELVLPVVAANTKYNSIIIPQDGINTVVVRIGGSDFVYTHHGDFNFESGKFTTIKLIVGRDQIDLDEVTINDWTPGDVIDGGEAYD